MALYHDQWSTVLHEVRRHLSSDETIQAFLASLREVIASGGSDSAIQKAVNKYTGSGRAELPSGLQRAVETEVFRFIAQHSHVLPMYLNPANNVPL